ncbi:hypothetical protein [Winogradskyella sp.]|uniref:hypothetical protein n=1 Tax=Winogradskyella sp. TaxID=1883156 RepID=UPI0025EF4A33|nr:hypothetical protein [Winogradskyella sp.]
MEEFKTKKDTNPVNIIIKPSSDAILDGPNKVRISIYNENAPRKWRKVKVIETELNKTFEATIEKQRIVDRPIIKIKTNLFADPLSKKDDMLKTTTVSYNLSSAVTDEKDYESTFLNHSEEYDPGSSIDQTFSVTKRIKTILT